MKTDGLNFDAQALREKILDLAMRGKLVRQEPNDEPASVLLEKIKAKKQSLIKDKKIRKSKALPTITDDEKLFDIPDSWEWTKLGNIAEIVMGQAPKSSTVNYGKNGVEFHQGKTEFTEEIIGNSNKYTTTLNKLINSNYVVMAVRAPVGDVNLVDRQISIGRGLAGIEGYNCNKKYIFYYLQGIKEYYDNRSTGSTFKAINGDIIKNTPFPLPPLSEQSRIAAKVAQLFALLRKVESSAKQYQNLQGLLKNKVLDLAMRGKLVKQDPNDEQASVLVKKSADEKSRLIKGKKIKRTKKLPAITDDEKPFDIPDSWEWVRLGNIITILRGGSPRPIKRYLTNDQSGINWIKIGDSTKDCKYIEHAAEKIIPEGLNKTRIVHKGDFLLSNSMSFGRPYILKIDGAVHDGWLILSNYGYVFNKDYLYYLLSSGLVNVQFMKFATGSTVKNLNRQRVENTVAVVPPLSEQSRIANKIKQLFSTLN